MLLFEFQATLMSTESPFVVLVSGGTASGKSSIVAQFVRKTGAAFIGHDRYYFDVPDPRGHDYDHPDSLDTDLLVSHVEQLRGGAVAALPVYDFATHTRQSRTESRSPAALIVVEGILVMSDPRLCALADLCVFVAAPEPVRLSRRIARDVMERGRTEESVRTQYLATVKPNHDRYVQPSKSSADLLLNGCDSIDESVARLMDAVPESVLVRLFR